MLCLQIDTITEFLLMMMKNLIMLVGLIKEKNQKMCDHKSINVDFCRKYASMLKDAFICDIAKTAPHPECKFCNFRKEVKSMSMDTYAAHLYGTAVDAPELLSKFENKNIDFYIIRDDFDLGEYDNYPKIPENIKDVEIIWGPDDIIYFGYSAIMPYKKSVHTKKEMDKNIYDFVKYFCGKNIADNIEITDIYDVWSD